MKFLIAIPAYNEETIIEQTMLTLDYFLRQNFNNHEYLVSIVDNNSNDLTANKVKNLLHQLKNFEYLLQEQKGKGAAIEKGWLKGLESGFEVLSFMDADLASDLKSLEKLLKTSLDSGLSIGDRFHKDSEVQRTITRNFVSRVYRFFSKIILNSKVSDFPCGFKAIRSDVYKNICNEIKNKSWFFDSELVYLAEKNNITPVHIPVKWQDPRSKIASSKVNIFKVGSQYFKELLRLRFNK